MSDPVKNAEIEDVLSSIRRLVSDDAGTPRPAPRSVPDRLVLTPSQRVPDHADDTATDIPAKSEAATDPVLLTDLVEAPDATAEPDCDHQEPSKADTAEVVSPSSLSQLVEDEIESALKDFAHVDRPPSEEAGDTAGAAKNGDVAAREAPDTAADAPEEAPTPTAVVDETATEAAQHRPKPAPSLEQKVAELEAMIAESGGDWEDDAPGDGDNAAFLQDADEPMAWQDFSDDAEAEDPRVAYFHPNRDAAIETAAQKTMPEDDLGADEPPVVDEEMLRDLVADIVRQELQGALGERITRNVRKLVRREIHRALISEQLD